MAKLTKEIGVAGRQFVARELTSDEIYDLEDHQRSWAYMVRVVFGPEAVKGLDAHELRALWNAVRDLTYGNQEQEGN